MVMKDIKERAKRLSEDKRYKWIIALIETLLYIGLGVAVGHTLHVDSVQDACNQHVVDNYYTPEIQRCLLNQGRNFTVPFQWSIIAGNADVRNNEE